MKSSRFSDNDERDRKESIERRIFDAKHEDSRPAENQTEQHSNKMHGRFTAGVGQDIAIDGLRGPG